MVSAPGPRTLFVTGAGGAGRTTAAAATAASAARSGAHTLLLTRDRAAAALAGLLPAAGPLPPAADGLPRPSPAPGRDGLYVAVIDSAASYRAGALDLQGRIGTLLAMLGAAPLDPEELTELPGAPELALLRALREARAPGAGGAPGVAVASGPADTSPEPDGHGSVSAPGTGTGAGPGTGTSTYDGPGAAPGAVSGPGSGPGPGSVSGSGPGQGFGPGAGATAGSAWDLVVVDLPPVREAVALLALPEQLRRYLRRLLPADRQAARALRPVLAQLAGVPMPAEWAYEAAGRADRELAAVQAVVADPGTAVTVVVEPGPGAPATLDTARTGLALHGHRLAAVVANRVLPTGSADPFLAGLSGRQQERIELLADRCAGQGQAPGGGPGPVLYEVAHAGADTAGWLPEVPVPPGGERPAEPWNVTDRLGEAGHLLWSLPLPGASRDGLDLVRRGDELVVDAGGFRRIVPLPSALRRCTVEGAALREGTLRVRFAPDPALWPR